MELTFRIDENYLIAHTLASMGPNAFSSGEHRDAIVTFQNFAWNTSRSVYDLLAGRLAPRDFATLTETVAALPETLTVLKESAAFRPIRSQTETYRSSCAAQWSENSARTSAILCDLTGLALRGSFTVFVTHPDLKNGRQLDDATIAWGHHEDWPNYTTVYLWHEILHTVMGREEVAHAVIQLIADNELRVRMNGGTYPLEGHAHLFPLMERILPGWREYLATNPPRDITAFIAEVQANGVNQNG